MAGDRVDGVAKLRTRMIQRYGRIRGWTDPLGGGWAAGSLGPRRFAATRCRFDLPHDVRSGSRRWLTSSYSPSGSEINFPSRCEPRPGKIIRPEGCSSQPTLGSLWSQMPPAYADLRTEEADGRAC